MNPLKQAIVSTISWYCTHSPVEPGKTRLQSLGLRLIGSPTLRATATSGLRFDLKFPEDRGFDHIYFRNTYETGTLDLLRQLVRPDDIVLDVGANMGWYTVHIASLLRDGMCHAFEPMPPTFQRLRHNCQLNEVTDRVALNDVALGDHHGTVQLHSFENLGHGHNSLSTLGRSDFTSWNVAMGTLDSYVAEKGLTRVDVVKMDVEGAEMGVIAGGASLLALDRPPIWIVEMNDETAASFGHRPADVVRAITARGRYRLFRILRSWDALRPMSSPDDYVHGDNAVCVPEERLPLWNERVAPLLRS